MTKTELYNKLQYVNHSRANREQMSQLVLHNQSLLPHLVEICFMVDDKTSCRAFWVLEYTCKKELALLLPHINFFVAHIAEVHLDPATRPVAKICECLLENYYGRNPSKIKEKLTQNHLEKITETCFDWLITDEKVAVKAHAMQSLFLLGKDFNWIYPELKLILKKDFTSHSAAYKARARRILKKI